MLKYTQLLSHPEEVPKGRKFSKEVFEMRERKRRVIIKRCGQQSTLYFRNFVYNPPKKVCSDALMDAIYTNKCSYGDVSQVSHGEISLSFNPLRHDRKARKALENKFKELIEQY